MLAELHKLPPVGQVRVEPGGCGIANTEVGQEAAEKHVVVDRVERCRYVEADQHRGFLVVCRCI